jgi:hypothetical protein
VTKHVEAEIGIAKWKVRFHSRKRKPRGLNGPPCPLARRNRRLAIKQRPRTGTSQSSDRAAHAIVLQIQHHVVSTREQAEREPPCQEKLATFTAAAAEFLHGPEQQQRARDTSILLASEKVELGTGQGTLQGAQVGQRNDHVAQCLQTDGEDPLRRRRVAPRNRRRGNVRISQASSLVLRPDLQPVYSSRTVGCRTPSE